MTFVFNLLLLIAGNILLLSISYDMLRCRLYKFEGGFANSILFNVRQYKTSMKN